jgi:hypothetical protein
MLCWLAYLLRALNPKIEFDIVKNVVSDSILLHPPLVCYQRYVRVPMLTVVRVNIGRTTSILLVAVQS